MLGDGEERRSDDDVDISAKKEKKRREKLTLLTFKVRQTKSVKNFRYQFYFSHLSWNH